MARKSTLPGRSGEQGSSIFESLIAIIVLCWIFFGIMQIFQWGVTKMFCDYASFYAAKGLSLGYAHRTIEKAARVAAVGVSGEDKSSPRLFSGLPLGNRLSRYMSSGNASLEFAYWDPVERDIPELQVSLTNYGLPSASPMTNATVRVKNLNMLHESWAKMLQIGTDKISPEGSTEMNNYAYDILQ